MSAGALLKQAESALLEQSRGAAPNAVFLLGAPRTGSTVVYQAFVARFGQPYLSNLANECFAETPIVALALQKAVPVAVGYESRFGKTDGALQPSEASAVMTHWFGGGHPSQTKSATILAGREPHFLATLAACVAIHGKPLAIKNAWNCFRVAYLARALPQARFLWIRRDIAEAALSDLEARHETKKSASEWNSATPANVEALRALPPAAQVLENQYEFNRAIGDALRAGAEGRWTELWYEDFVSDPQRALEGVGRALGLAPVAGAPAPRLEQTRERRLNTADSAELNAYLRAQGTRLESCRYGATGKERRQCSS
jgi:hypothetical protein